MGKKRRIKKFLQKFGGKFSRKYGAVLEKSKAKEPEIIEDAPAVINEVPVLKKPEPKEVIAKKPEPKEVIVKKPAARKPAARKPRKTAPRKTTKPKTT
jgi:hypothetical protein